MFLIYTAEPFLGPASAKALSEVVEATRYLDERKAVGKIVLTI